MNILKLNHMPHYGGNLQKYCQAKEATQKRIFTVRFYLCVAQKQTDLWC